MTYISISGEIKARNCQGENLRQALQAQGFYFRTAGNHFSGQAEDRLYDSAGAFTGFVYTRDTLEPLEGEHKASTVVLIPALRDPNVGQCLDSVYLSISCEYDDPDDGPEVVCFRNGSWLEWITVGVYAPEPLVSDIRAAMKEAATDILNR